MKKNDLIDFILENANYNLLSQFPWCYSKSVIERYYSKSQLKYIAKYIEKEDK